MGKVVYESALRSPDTLAEVVDPTREYETTSSGVGWIAWTDKTGHMQDKYCEIYNLICSIKHPVLIEADWPDTADELRRHFPRLSAMYLTNDAP